MMIGKQRERERERSEKGSSLSKHAILIHIPWRQKKVRKMKEDIEKISLMLCWNKSGPGLNIDQNKGRSHSIVDRAVAL